MRHFHQLSRGTGNCGQSQMESHIVDTSIHRHFLDFKIKNGKDRICASIIFFTGFVQPCPKSRHAFKGLATVSELPHRMPLLIPTRQRQMGNVC